MAKAFLLYDDGCGVCTTAKDLVRRADVTGEISFLGLRSVEARGMASGLSEEEYWSAFHLVTATGVSSGASAFEELLGVLPLSRSVRRAMDELPPVRSGARGLFEFAMRLRGDLQCQHTPPARDR